MSKHNVLRINLTLKDQTVDRFQEHINTIRIKEIKEGELKLTSTSQLASQLITQALTPNYSRGNMGISIDKLGRGTIRVPKNMIEEIGLQKGDRIVLTITKYNR